MFYSPFSGSGWNFLNITYVSVRWCFFEIFMQLFTRKLKKINPFLTLFFKMAGSISTYRVFVFSENASFIFCDFKDIISPENIFLGVALLMMLFWSILSDFAALKGDFHRKACLNVGIKDDPGRYQNVPNDVPFLDVLQHKITVKDFWKRNSSSWKVGNDISFNYHYIRTAP